MKTNFLILSIIVFLLAVPLSMKAQKAEYIRLNEGTDSAVKIRIYDDYVWIDTRDSLVIMRRDLWDSKNVNQRKKTKKNSYFPPVEELHTFSGKIIGWHHNQNFRLDGFFLQTENDTLRVEFIPSMATRIKALDESVEVSGTIRKHKKKKRGIIQLVKIQDTKDTIYRDMKFVFYANRRIPEQIIHGSGKINQIISSEFKFNKSIDIQSCILDSNTVLRFSITSFEKINPILEKLDTNLIIKYSGQEIPLRAGEVIDGNYKVILCYTITIDGTEYIIDNSTWSMEGIRKY